jgi:hypothetical protein
MKRISISLCSTFLILVLSSCFRPNHPFEKDTPPPPDYSKESCWAALPNKKDSAKAVPPNSGLKDEESDAKADVFFIYPTTYYSHKSWNADVNDENLDNMTDKTTIMNQASVFNGSCRVYAPRYRQATLYAFFERDGKDNGKMSLDLAYKDVKAAFEYYLKYYNHGRPIIIASHSQGTWHAMRLLKDYFEKNAALRKQLVAAYLIGGPVRKDFSSVIPPCDSASQTGCYIAWNTRKWGDVAFPKDKRNPELINYNDTTPFECVNPLTWKRDTIYAPASLNDGSIPRGYSRIDLHVADAKCAPDGTLWVHKPKQDGYPDLLSYHILDYNFFWMNIRENVKLRVNTYLASQH